MANSSLTVLSGLDLAYQKKVTWKIQEFNVMLSSGGLDAHKFYFEVDESFDITKSKWVLALIPDKQQDLIKLYYKPTNPADAEDGTVKSLVHKATVCTIGTDGNKSNISEGPGVRYSIGPNATKNEPICILEVPTLDVPLVGRSVIFEFTLALFKNHQFKKIDFQRFSVPQTPHKLMKQQYLDILNDKEMSDFKIVSNDGKEFYPHQLILKARSTFFEAMFRLKGKEYETRTLTLDDLSSVGVQFLLHYIYGGDVSPFSLIYEEPEPAECSVHDSDSDNKNNTEIDEGNSEPLKKCARRDDAPTPTDKKVAYETNKINIKEVLYIASKYGLEDLQNAIDEGLGNHCNEQNAWFLLQLCKKYTLKSADVIRSFILERPPIMKQLLDGN